MLAKVVIKILILVFLSIGLFSKTPHELVDIISDSTMDVKYYFYIIDKSPFLSKKNPKGGYSVWYYTGERKWQPIHNASAFDGFSKADNIFDNVDLGVDKRKVMIGSISNQNLNSEVLALAKKIENKDINIGWYFWTTNGNAFLLKQKDNNKVSIWYYTSNRKWQPIHNANAFDGFPAIQETLDNIKFNPKISTIEVGGININFFDATKLVPPTPTGFSF